MIRLTDVFVAVNDTLKASFKNIKTYKERINKLDRPLMSVELISFSTSPQSRFIINKSIDLDIIYFSKDNSVEEALKVADKLMSAFSLGLSVRAYGKVGAMVEKRHLHCMKPPEYKLVDQDLHFLVRFDFADELEAYHLADDGQMKAYNKDYEKPISKKPDGSDGKTDEEPKTNASIRPADNKDFAKDIEFKSEDKKKDYEEEKIKLMQSLKLNYEILEV